MTKMSETRWQGQLLSEHDPDPVEIINSGSEHPLVLVCEHAGQAIPSRLSDLGISQAALDSHIGWDIGAEKVTRQMATTLGATAIIQRYSRLVIDCNRPSESHEAIPEISDSVAIPGNQALSDAQRTARVDEIFVPYQKAIEKILNNDSCKIVLSIHSFTRCLNGKTRPWEIGFLFRKDVDTSQRLSTLVKIAHPELNVGMNMPYQIDDNTDWFVPRHGEARQIPHSLIEIRNDQIETAKGQAFWARTLVSSIEYYLRES